MRELFRDNELRKFLAVSFAWAAFLGLLMWFFRIRFQSWSGLILVSAFYMLSPAVVVLWLKGFNFGALAREYNLGLSRSIFQNAVIYSSLFLIIYFVVYLFISFILGSVPTLNEYFGRLSFIPSDYKFEFYKTTRARGDVNIPGFSFLVGGGLLGAFLAGITINGVFALGEEVAWRGFIRGKLAKAGESGSGIVTGIIWGFWHAPLILLGYNFPHHPFAGVFYMLILTVPMSVLLSSAVRTTGTLWTAAIIHGMFNAFSFLNIIVVQKVAPFGGILGITGAVTLFVTWKLLGKFDKNFR